MGTANLTNSQLLNLADCISNGRMGQGISYASTAFFLYDYSLTVWDEARFVWLQGRISVSVVAYILARYCAMATAIIILLPSSRDPFLDNINTILRLISVIASEFLVAVRTWAIWTRSRAILITLVFFSLAAIIPAAVIVGESTISNHVVTLVTPEFTDICSLTISNISQSFVVLYVLTILYEFVTLTLSLIRIVKWRKTIPKHVRAPIIDTLWRDGVLYFSFMLVLGFMNIAIVMQSGVPQVRTGCAQLQTVFHSLLSTRMVLHLRDIETPGCSVYARTAMEFSDRTGFDTSTVVHGYGGDNEF